MQPLVRLFTAIFLNAVQCTLQFSLKVTNILIKSRIIGPISEQSYKLGLVVSVQSNSKWHKAQCELTTA